MNIKIIFNTKYKIIIQINPTDRISNLIDKIVDYYCMYVKKIFKIERIYDKDGFVFVEDIELSTCLSNNSIIYVKGTECGFSEEKYSFLLNKYKNKIVQYEKVVKDSSDKIDTSTYSKKDDKNNILEKLNHNNETKNKKSKLKKLYDGYENTKKSKPNNVRIIEGKPNSDINSINKNSRKLENFTRNDKESKSSSVQESKTFSVKEVKNSTFREDKTADTKEVKFSFVKDIKIPFIKESKIPSVKEVKISTMREDKPFTFKEDNIYTLREDYTHNVKKANSPCTKETKTHSLKEVKTFNVKGDRISLHKEDETFKIKEVNIPSTQEVKIFNTIEPKTSSSTKEVKTPGVKETNISLEKNNFDRKKEIGMIDVEQNKSGTIIKDKVELDVNLKQKENIFTSKDFYKKDDDNFKSEIKKIKLEGTEESTSVKIDSIIVENINNILIGEDNVLKEPLLGDENIDFNKMSKINLGTKTKRDIKSNPFDSFKNTIKEEDNTTKDNNLFEVEDLKSRFLNKKNKDLKEVIGMKDIKRIKKKEKIDYSKL